MTTPPTAASTPLTPGPMPPPVDGAPTGTLVVYPPEVPTLGVGLAVAVEVSVDVSVAVADADVVSV